MKKINLEKIGGFILKSCKIQKKFYKKNLLTKNEKIICIMFSF